MTRATASLRDHAHAATRTRRIADADVSLHPTAHAAATVTIQRPGQGHSRLHVNSDQSHTISTDTTETYRTGTIVPGGTLTSEPGSTLRIVGE